MKLYLISNNALFNNLNYNYDTPLDPIRALRPLSIEGERVAQKIAEEKCFNNIESIYSSTFSSAISTSKYLSQKLDLEVYLDSKLNDVKVGILGTKSMPMLKGIQEREFTYKLEGGESLIEASNRMDFIIKGLANKGKEPAIFTHKRAILAFLLKYTKIDYNLDDNLVLIYNDNIIYDDNDDLYNIYEIEINNEEITSIRLI